MDDLGGFYPLFLVQHPYRHRPTKVYSSGTKVYFSGTCQSVWIPLPIPFKVSTNLQGLIKVNGAKNWILYHEPPMISNLKGDIIKFMAGFSLVGPLEIKWLHFGGWSLPSRYVEDHPRTRKWLITMVIVSPLMIGLFPFQMAEMACKWVLLTTPLTKSPRTPSPDIWKRQLILPTAFGEIDMFVPERVKHGKTL